MAQDQIRWRESVVVERTISSASADAEFHKPELRLDKKKGVQGSQYTSVAFGQRCAKMGVRPSMGRSWRRLRQHDGREFLREPGVRTHRSAQLLDQDRGAHGTVSPFHLIGDYEEQLSSICEEPIRGADLLTFEDKYASGKATKGMGGAGRNIPADIPTHLAENIQTFAVTAFSAVQASGVARVDFLYDTSKKALYVNEINTIPGSLRFYLWEHSHLSFTQMTERLIQLALKRARDRAAVSSTLQNNLLASASLLGTKSAKL